MGETVTRLYAVNVTPLEDAMLYQRAYGRATKERQRRLDRLLVPGERRLSLGAELLLLHGLGQQGFHPGDVLYQYEEDGKPYLTGRPERHFNISHSGELAICAISSCRIGCDVEQVTTWRREVARRFFAEKEYKRILAQASDRERQDLFFRLWTMKESFVKGIGKGLRLELDSFCINLDDNGRPLPLSWEGELYHFREFEIQPGYKCSVCGLDSAIAAEQGVEIEWVSVRKLITDHE